MDSASLPDQFVPGVQLSQPLRSLSKRHSQWRGDRCNYDDLVAHVDRESSEGEMQPLLSNIKLLVQNIETLDHGT